MDYWKEQLALHPLTQPQDAAKFCFQAVYGAEHLLHDPDAARVWFFREWESTPPLSDRPLLEPLSDRYDRVDLSAWKAQGRSPELLFSLFLQTAQPPSPAVSSDLETALREVGDLAKNGCFSFSPRDWESFLAAYDRAPLHHSELYRRVYRPAYRVVCRGLTKFTVDNP